MARLEWYILAHLKPRHFQLLAALDDHRHVGRAARFLNVSQPAVSKALAELERGLGLPLFERGPRGLWPTEFGHRMIRSARSMLRELAATGEELHRLKSGVTDCVRIGMLPVAVPALAPRAAIRFRQRRPDAAVTLHEGTADRMLPLLREGQLDLVVGILPPASMSEGLRHELLHDGESLAAVCGPQHALAQRRRVQPSELAAYDWIVPPLGAIFRDVVRSAMQALGLPLAGAAIESGSMTATNTLLRESSALSLYSAHLAHHYARLGLVKIVPMALPRIAMPLGCMWPSHVETSAATQQMLQCLREAAQEVLVAP